MARRFFLLLAFVASSTWAGQPVAGWGALPLGSAVSSLWLTGPESPDKSPPLAIAFYLGPDGWHDREWTFDSEVLSPAGRVTLRSAGLELSLVVDPGKASVTIQGQAFDLSKANAFVVRRFLGEAAAAEVAPLGLYPLAQLPPADSAARAFLRQYPEAEVKISAALEEDVAAARATLPLRPTIAGTWGMEGEGVSCADNPHTLAFSPDGLEMKLQYAKGGEGTPPTEVTYVVVSEGPGVLRLAKNGEDMRSEAGELVQWDLVLLGADSYCWHRSDWQAGGCTKPAVRCAKHMDAHTGQVP